MVTDGLVILYFLPECTLKSLRLPSSGIMAKLWQETAIELSSLTMASCNINLIPRRYNHSFLY